MTAIPYPTDRSSKHALAANSGPSLQQFRFVGYPLSAYKVSAPSGAVSGAETKGGGPHKFQFAAPRASRSFLVLADLRPPARAQARSLRDGGTMTPNLQNLALDSAAREWTLKDIATILLRRRWLIAAVVCFATIGAAMFSLTLTPQFRATTTLSIERNSLRVLSEDLERTESGSHAFESFFNTQYRILSSDAILRRVIDLLDLRARPALLGVELEEQDRVLAGRQGESAPAAGPALPKLPGLENLPAIPGVTTGVPALAGDPVLDEALLRALRSGLKVEPVLGSNLVNVHFESKDADFAATAANAVAEAYTQFSREEKLELAEQSEGFFADRVHALRLEVVAGETRLKEYAHRHGILTGDYRDAARQHFTEVQARYTEALGDLAARQAALSAAKGADGAVLEEVRTHPLMQQLYAALVEKESEYTSLVSRLGPEYPEVRRLGVEKEKARKQVEETQRELARQALLSRDVAFREATERASQLDQLLEQARARVDDLERAMIEYEQLKVEIDRKKTMLDELVSKRNSMLLAASMGENAAQNVRTINPAVTPLKPHSPNKTRMVLVGMMLGLFLGVGVAVLLEALDESLKSAEDAAQTLGLPVLGEVPEMREATAMRLIGSGKGKRPEAGFVVSAALPRSAEAEAYRELRTAYLTLAEGAHPHLLVVTSAMPGEGKSTTAVNLAATLGQIGRRVLLVDTDLRRPMVHRIVGVTPEWGVTHALHGVSGASVEELRITPTRMENVDVLPSGPIPPSPAELLDSKRFTRLVEMLRQSAVYDVVIFDSPPVMSVVDPVLVGRHCDGALLVVRAGKVSRKLARQAKQKLQAGQVTVMGALVNGLAASESGYGYYRYYRSHDESETTTTTKTRRRRADAS